MGKTHTIDAPRTDAAGRRRFLQLVAGSAAALMVGSLPTRRAAAQSGGGGKKAKKAAPERSEKVEAELENQRKYVASTLETIRKFDLPPGSEVGFVFRPLRKTKGKARKTR